MATAAALRKPIDLPDLPGLHKASIMPKTGIMIDGQITIPENFADLASFHRWTESDEYPETGRYCYLNGLTWVDLSMEQLFTHVQVKTRSSRVLDALVEDLSLGYFFSDGARISNAVADLSSELDAVFASFAAIAAGRVKLVPGRFGGTVRIDGSPDMVLEVVSDSSFQKDTDLLRTLYWKAEITEFWLIDVRDDALEFQILKRGPKGYTRTKKQPGGWLRSQVFGRSFCLTRETDRLGNPNFTLLVRD